MLVLAGPGSGKTRVITCRVAYLIQQGVRPAQILAITFTNKAAGEMQQRVEAHAARQAASGSARSTASACACCAQYADRLGLDRNFTIYDQTDRVRVVKTALEAAGIDNVRFTPDTIQGAISKAKNQLLTARAATRARRTTSSRRSSPRSTPSTRRRCATPTPSTSTTCCSGPPWPCKNDAELRAELDARFRYVLIDEYQDTNKAQYAIARGLSVDHPNLCVVGDPDQSIYSWRGSDIRNILDFERDFPDARVITLGENFRSTKAILHAADHLIAHNKQRKPKTLVHRQRRRASRSASCCSRPAWRRPTQVVQRIREAVEDGQAPLSRLRHLPAHQRPVAHAGNGVRPPARAVPDRPRPGVLRTQGKQDVLAYLRLLLNPRDDLSFLRAVNEPARGIGKTSLEHLQNYAEPREMSLLSAAEQVDKIPAIKGKAATGLQGFAALMTELRDVLDATPDEVIRQVIDRSGYRRMLQGQRRHRRPGTPGQHRGTHHRGPSVPRRGQQPHHRAISWRTSRWPATSTAGTRSRIASR